MFEIMLEILMFVTQQHIHAMKRFVFPILLLFFSMAMNAQDVLITKEGDVILAYELEVGNSYIFYKTGENDGSLLKIAKKDVLMIKYKDGRKLIIENNEEKGAPAQNSDIPQASSINDATMEVYCKTVEYLQPSRQESADIIFCRCLPLPGSIFADENMELLFHSSASMFSRFAGILPCCNKLKVSVRNKTNKILYLDLGGTFFRRGKSSQACFVPSATVSTTSNTTGGAVNLGALGVGGVFASGVTIGNANTKTSSTTVFAQRIIGIPPFTESEIGDFDLFIYRDTESYSNQVYLKRELIKYNYDVLYLGKALPTPLVGEAMKVTNTNLVQFGAFITYAADEQQTEPKFLNASFYLDEVIGIKAEQKGTMKCIACKHMTPGFGDFSVFFVALPNKP